MNVFEQQVQAKYAEVAQGTANLNGVQKREAAVAKERKKLRRLRHLDSAIGIPQQRRGNS